MIHPGSDLPVRVELEHGDDVFAVRAESASSGAVAVVRSRRRVAGVHFDGHAAIHSSGAKFMWVAGRLPPGAVRIELQGRRALAGPIAANGYWAAALDAMTEDGVEARAYASTGALKGSEWLDL